MLKEKTMITHKNNISLRSFFAMVVVLSLAFGFVLPIKAQAAWDKPVNYTDLDYTVRYGNEVNIVRFNIPAEYFMFQIKSDSLGDDSPLKIMGKDTCYVVGESGYFEFEFFPLTTYGLLLENIPVGTELHIGAKFSSDLWYEKDYTKAYQRARYMDSNNKWLSNKLAAIDYSNEYFISIGERECYRPEEISIDYVIEDFAGSNSFVPAYRLVDSYSPNGSFTVTVSACYIEMEVSVAAWTQFQTELNGEKLDAINDSLGNLNDKVDTLPEDIGNEMQGVIDSENEKAESSGNKFVNQILDKLPDPSTEVLGSLKALTDSMAYTGTDCKLQIPALVIPAIDGLFPETEIWGGTEFSFSDYLSFLPPALLTVVQSLFTIAIVLFCVYELKGIISYCLTLNDKKGG